MSTMLVLTAVMLLVILAAACLIRDKKKGKASCGYHCQGCVLRGYCHKKH